MSLSLDGYCLFGGIVSCSVRSLPLKPCANGFYDRAKKNYALCMSMRMVSGCRRVLFVANSISRYIRLSCARSFSSSSKWLCCGATAHSFVCRYLHLYVQINRVHLK